MALTNFTLAAPAAPPSVIQTSPVPFRVDFDDLLYSPDQQEYHESQQHDANEPFTPPASAQRKAKPKKRNGAPYLPPQNQFTHYTQSPQPNVPHNPYNPHIHTQVYQQNPRLDIPVDNHRGRDMNRQYDPSGQYIHDPSGDYDYDQRRIDQLTKQLAYNPRYSNPPFPPPTSPPPSSSRSFQVHQTQNVNYKDWPSTPAPLPELKPGPSLTESHRLPQPPEKPRGFTKVETGSSGGKTQLHAVLDYDDEDYYDDVPGPGPGQPAVTPLQGPILLRNGSVPVVPLTTYPTTNNGSFYQIPILWTALSVALGYELQGQVIKGVPCVKRNFQLYCPTAGNTYPLDKIETFIDENKALIKRMYGSFTVPGGARTRRAPGVPDMHAGDSYFRHVRQAATNLPDPQSVNNTGRVDACESKTEIMTPYWALNSARKLRAIVNTMHFEQAIHQEVCSKKSTSRCSNDCGCEQKYKWHRLLAYDPSDDCAGIFMDWFLFPSCCVCRCNP